MSGITKISKRKKSRKIVKMTDELAIGVDLGGTNIRIAISDSAGNFLDSREKKTETSNIYSISKEIINEVRSLCEKEDVKVENLRGVGIASTGPMDIDRGVLIKPTNIPFEKVPLVQPIEDELDIPTYLLNDCTAGVLGERVFGKGREEGIRDIVYVNIGTGIGGGAIIDEHLLLGKDGNAAEIGHMTVDVGGQIECGCGGKGHWEAYCSGKNIPNFVRSELEDMDEKEVEESLLLERAGNLENITTKLFYEAVKEEDDLALQLVSRINKLNCVGFGNLVDVYDPSLITVGGSVALKNEDQVIKPVNEEINKHIRNEKPEIVATPLKDKIGIYGALAEVFQ